MPEYGLTSLRESDGTRKPQEHTFQWGGREVTIKFIPPDLAGIEEFEGLMEREDLDVEEIQSILDRHLVEPSIPEEESWTLREFQCYITGMYEWSMEGAGSHAEIREELEQHIDDEGN